MMYLDCYYYTMSQEIEVLVICLYHDRKLLITVCSCMTYVAALSHTTLQSITNTLTLSSLAKRKGRSKLLYSIRSSGLLKALYTLLPVTPAPIEHHLGFTGKYYIVTFIIYGLTHRVFCKDVKFRILV